MLLFLTPFPPLFTLSHIISGGIPHLPLQPFSASFLGISSKIVHTSKRGEKAKIVALRKDI